MKSAFYGETSLKLGPISKKIEVDPKAPKRVFAVFPKFCANTRRHVWLEMVEKTTICWGWEADITYNEIIDDAEIQKAL
jgi:hypothetical protein